VSVVVAILTGLLSAVVWFVVTLAHIVIWCARIFLAWFAAYPAAGLGLLILVLAGAVFVRMTLFSGQQVRRMRWHVRFRLRPGMGYASLGQVIFRWSVLAALRSGARARPSMSLVARVMHSRTEYALRLGRAPYGINVYGRLEDMLIMIAPPRIFKTAMVGDWLLDWPGAALVTETRPDLLEATAGWRHARYGPVHYFNPENVGGYESTFRWGLTIGCENPKEAGRRAADLVDAVAVEGDMKWWAEKAAAALAAALHCAALTHNDITAVWAWANGRGEAMIQQAARLGASPELLGALNELKGTGKTAESIRITMSKALAWVAVPEMAAMVTGPEAVPFNVPDWIERRGTIYMLAPGGDDATLIAPLFRCFASFVHRQAIAYAQMLGSRRLDPRLGFFLDELHMCPVNLPAWLAVSAASGIQVFAVVHSEGQLLDKYGKAGTRTVLSTTMTKLILPGIHDTETLRWVSELCGRLPGDRGDGKPDFVAPEEFIRTLPLKRALALRANLDPVVVRFRPSWTRLDQRVRRWTGGPLTPPRPAVRMAPYEVDSELAEITAGLHLVTDEPDKVPAVAEPEADAGESGDLIG
jgi:hypothetical protein